MDTPQGPIEPLIPPRRASIPLWLALILKRQRRANILPPPWLHPESLSFILDIETQRSDYKTALSPGPPLPGQTASTSVPVPQYSPDRRPHYVSPPFLPQNVVSSDQTGDNLDRPPALPYHWMEVANMLLDAASDDLADPDQTRRLLKDLREVRLAKIRAGVDVLDAAAGPGGGVALTGVGAMEAGEGRRFVSGVIDGLRYVCAHCVVLSSVYIHYRLLCLFF